MPLSTTRPLLLCGIGKDDAEMKCFYFKYRNTNDPQLSHKIISPSITLLFPFLFPYTKPPFRNVK